MKIAILYINHFDPIVDCLAYFIGLALVCTLDDDDFLMPIQNVCSHRSLYSDKDVITSDHFSLDVGLLKMFDSFDSVILKFVFERNQS